MTTAGFVSTERTTVRRKPQRATYDRAVVHAILDEGLIASVACSIDGLPFVQPMIYARDGDVLIFHGHSNNRLMNHMAAGGELCANVMLVDGLILARSIEDHSMAYRSVNIHGRATELTDAKEKARAMRIVFDNIVRSDRYEHLPPLAPGYLGGTRICVLPLVECVAKVNGPPEELEEESEVSIWSGVIPVEIRSGAPRPDGATVQEGLQPPPSVTRVWDRSEARTTSGAAECSGFAGQKRV